MTAKKKQTAKKQIAKKKPIDLKALVEEVLNASAYSGRCLIPRLDEGARDFFAAMVLAEKQGNRKVMRKKVREVLRREFDVTLSEHMVLKHFRGECRECEKTNSNNS